MANEQSSGRHYEYVKITTIPGADGDRCSPVTVKKSKDVEALFFSRRGGGVATVSIQFKTPEEGAAWTDYLTSEALDDGARLRLDELGTGVQWRAGVANGDYTSGDVTVGFDW